MKPDRREWKMMVVGAGESEKQAFAREGLDPNNPDFDFLIIRVVEPGERLTSLETSESR